MKILKKCENPSKLYDSYSLLVGKNLLFFLFLGILHNFKSL